MTTAVTFGQYFALADASGQAPNQPGVFQVKLATGLIDYPSGKSAMLHYSPALDLGAAIEAFALAHRGRDWRCRFVATSRASADELAGQLLSRFVSRFGSEPRVGLAIERDAGTTGTAKTKEDQ